MLDMRRLRLLHELHLRGTLAAVADALRYSPSSVSQQLALLERETGVELLQKSGRRVLLTPQGELLARRAGRLLDELELAESELAASLDEVTGTVRLAVFQSAAHAVVPSALARVAQDFPELRVEVVEREPDIGLFEVSARDFDLVIAEQYPGHTRVLRPELDREHLLTDVIRLAAPPTGPWRVGSLADAVSLPWVLEPRGTASRTWALQTCRAVGFEPDVRFETADLVAHMRLIRSGAAVGFLPDLVWAGGPADVALVELDGSPHREVFSSARRSSAARPGVLAVRGALRDTVAGFTA
ncbi:LysR family transcriptional regulator [Labedella populi]|uniref:LysR family transcriptional regulator n=1 Tax=Labedella populi TaxID=2498850 RepID=A0A444QEQ0_9MICO|nr:LysR family transcriptional regulator [Labedella populi]RWZ68010.1 LysR family transcriptional regulator [Labedella populi]